MDSFRFKDGIIEKIKWLYEEIFKDIEIPTTGDMIKDEKIIKQVKDILSEQVVKKKILENQQKIYEICQNILKSPNIKAISIHSFDNTPVYFIGDELAKIREWLHNWNLSTPPEPFKFEFGNYLDRKSLQGIVMNSGISIVTEKNFLLYYIFGDAANLGLHMDWLSGELNKVIG